VLAKDRKVLTVPNAISLIRILLVPVIVWLLATDGVEGWGLVLLVAVVATDWVDGYLARRTGQVTELGKILDPVADRLVVAAALITLVFVGAFPLWAAFLVIARDVALLVVGAFFLRRSGIRIDVRFIGKAATFCLMAAVPMIAWGNFGLPAAPATLAVGWPVFAVGVLEAYIAAWMYAIDLRVALSRGETRAPS
jgi:CDP-diacylglycerol--glycerol-3-phosphate 3-phosphatidyltransferase